VLATLHTNDAPGAVTRLIDMGIEPYLLASTLNGVLAQRLVRKLCPQCRTPSESDSGERTYRHVGCAACNFSGYKGRTGIYELLTVDDDLRRLIHDLAEERLLREHAVTHGMVRLRDDGMRWVREGVSSMDEVLRVTRN
jgi:general secretion pathway protein E